MKLWLNKLRRIYLHITNSIAFFPSLLAIVFLFFSFFVIRIEFIEEVVSFKESISPLLVHNSNNARLILGTIVGSLISLMVFSFSMVMVVLNSATATLSPRVLPSLISNKFHQIVLGFYIGSIIFSLNLIVNIDSPDIEYATPSLGIFFSMNMVIVCLGLFVYFIHSISEKIQVDSILNDIKISTTKTIEIANFKLPENDKKASEKDLNPAFEGWFKQKSGKSGFLKRTSYNDLQDFCKENDVQVKMEIKIGTYLVEHYPFALTSKPLNKEQHEALMSCFILYTQEHINDHFSFGFGQISEIAVKALSPGINDPGTAIRAIDLLAELFIKLMLIKQQYFLMDEEDNICVYLMPITFQNTLYKTLTPIRNYGQKDVLVMLRLLDSLEKMLEIDNDKKTYFEKMHEFIDSTISCCCGQFENKMDRDQLNKIIYKINAKFPSQEQFTLI